MFNYEKNKENRRLQELAGLEVTPLNLFERFYILFMKFKCLLSFHKYEIFEAPYFIRMSLGQGREIKICETCSSIKVRDKTKQEEIEWQAFKSRMEKFLEPVSQEQIKKLKPLIEKSVEKEPGKQHYERGN